MSSLRAFRNYLMVLAAAIVGLMALGAGVRTMRAGLSCPDWPLCFGKVIPDFHVGVWFEFVHRAYAGLVALMFLGAMIWAWRSREVPRIAKWASVVSAVFLTLQILMGALTVLWLVKALVVTTHLLLATVFLVGVWVMLIAVQLRLQPMNFERRAPVGLRALSLALPLLIFVQIAIGGLVASTYSGSVCVDWPLCNGQWVPTWRGAIGLQIIHRFVAYALTLVILAMAIWAWKSPRIDTHWKKILNVQAGLVLAQLVCGVANLMMYIPPSITVLHQSLAVALLGASLWVATRAYLESFKSAESPAASRVPRSEMPADPDSKREFGAGSGKLPATP
ncbi:MAG TPA: COX15/CtaA family protein [Pseudobdellovibrionaceae bacterium]|nr:COX15/CtaA family protein [Pseudobdellovibrionaceae bacterium]